MIVKSFAVLFRYRTITCLILLCAVMLFGMVRLFQISTDSRLVSATTNTVTVELQNSRGTVYDRNGRRITSSVEGYAIVFLPCEQGMFRFMNEAKDTEREAGLARLRQKKPTVLLRETAIEAVGVYSYPVRERYGESIGLEHLLGYLDESGHGVTGLELAFDELLFSNEGDTVSFAYDAAGNVLTGYQPIYRTAQQSSALYLSIDRELQSICWNASATLDKGAVVVSEIKTGRIRAMVSRPGFSVTSLSEYIEREDSPFLNRVLCAYSVGSVFKPLIAAAMLEGGKENFTHTCTGYSEFLGLRFACNDHNGHGTMGLGQALTLSCNTYFYNGAAEVSPDSLTDLAAALGFGNSVSLCDGIQTDAGQITSVAELSRSAAAVANFAIGQGNIALSPLVLCNLYSAIANDGVYYAPTVVEGVYENGQYTACEAGSKNVVFSKGTAAVLKEYLIRVVEEGTGTAAKPEQGGAGGKTATAQTGQYHGDTEMLNAWFCGFFPADDPQYTVVVMAEDATSGSGDSAPIFEKIATATGKMK